MRWQSVRAVRQAKSGRLITPICVALLGATLVLTAGCERNDAGLPARASGGAVPVSVAGAAQQDIPVQVPAIGTVWPAATVTLKPQINGQITSVHFDEGQHVKSGDLLFKIDPRWYQSALDHAEAMLAKDTAMAKDAEGEAAWMHGLYQDQSAAEREDRRTQANADALRAQVQADQAAAESARLQLDYCQVRAPLAGRVGRRMVDPGNIVKENESALVVVNQIQPIDVLFAVAEEQLPRIKQYQAAAPLRVEAVIAGDEGGPEVGTLIFIDNSVDRTTGTINLKARFQNDGGRLWPGQFVNVTLILTVRKGATVIPARAVQNGQSGPYVFVVREDQTVESRPVVTGVSAAEFVAIDEGIKPGETVVTDGQLRLVTGTKVQIKPQSAPTADATS